MEIANHNWFWFLLPLCLGALGLALFTFGRDRKDLQRLGAHHLVLAPGMAWARRLLKGGLLLTGLCLIFLGAVRLQGKPLPEDLDLRGSDVMIVLDLSKSMLTQDMVPNRLEAAKKALLSWVQNRDGDRVGLVVFAGEALVQVPLTMDLEAVSTVLSRDDVDAVDRGGTDIGEGIRTALSVFDKDEKAKRGKAILLLTDGEDTDGATNLGAACGEAEKRGIPIITVGMGTRQGRPIPDGVSFWGEPVYKQDGVGNVHVSRLDEKTLQEIADKTDGLFIHGDSTENLSGIDGAFNKLQKSEMKGKGAVRRRELAPSLGAWAVASLLLSGLL